MHAAHKTVLALFVLLLFACRAKQDGAIEGRVAPSGMSACISAMQNGKNILTVPTGGRTGNSNRRSQQGPIRLMLQFPILPTRLI